MQPFTLTALFDRTGDAVAVKDPRRACTYTELHASADALARELQADGVRRGDAVVIYAERSVETVVAVLAVLKSGAAFVPVSLDTPPARFEVILNDASAKLLLVDDAAHERLAGRDLFVPTRNAAVPAAGQAASRRPDPALDVHPTDPAYIIYTSGTSGEPKGILIEHGAISRRYDDWNAAYGLSASRPRVLQGAKLGFDVFAGDLVKALGSGGTLVICPGEVLIDPARLHATIVDEAIDYFDTVPAVLRQLVEYLETTGRDLSSLPILNCGADLWTKDEYERARRITKVGRLFNSYGVTEVSVENTIFEDDGTLQGRSTLPIGRALPNDTVLIVDESLHPVPPGVVGQLCIGGPCVTRGYVNRPELNERAFFVRTDEQGHAVRFYKTGDLARIDAHGIIDFLGRIDFQVKINGYRIELEEIERVLERFPNVRQAVVCYDEPRRALAAFVRTAGGAPLRTAECLAHAARHLPSYMVPLRVLALDAFPLNQNGKVDRAALTRSLADVPLKANVHDLHESRDAAELRAKLAARGIDLLSLVNEFVKPSAEFDVRITGALADGTGHETSPLELLVLLDGANAMKRRRSEVAGRPVEYQDLPGDAVRVSLTLEGLDVSIELRAGSLAEAQ